MTDKGKKTIAKMLLDKAQGKFDFNVGQGYGLFLLSAYYESSALPGEDAAFVHSVVVEMLESALQVKANFEAVQKTEVV